MRLTPLAVMILALLNEDDMHPYEMLRLMRHRRDDRIVPVTGGTVYNTVARLARQGFIDEVGVDREGNRPERTTYRLLPAGADALRDWVREELPRGDRPAEFRVALAEAHNLDRDEVLALLERRCEVLQEESAMTLAGLAEARQQRVPEQHLVEPDRQAALVAAELVWLGALLERLRAPGFIWGIGESPLRTDHYLAQRKAARQ